MCSIYMDDYVHHINNFAAVSLNCYMEMFVKFKWVQLDIFRILNIVYRLAYIYILYTKYKMQINKMFSCNFIIWWYAVGEKTILNSYYINTNYSKIKIKIENFSKKASS